MSHLLSRNVFNSLKRFQGLGLSLFLSTNSPGLSVLRDPMPVIFPS